MNPQRFLFYLKNSGKGASFLSFTAVRYRNIAKKEKEKIKAQ